MTERRPLAEAAIRQTLTAETGEPAPLPAGDISRIAIEGDWAAVTLRTREISRDRLAAIHARLTAAFPGSTFELRAGQYVFRGGYGFGKGRHLIAVLGGKGGVGKSTTALNLALTLAAMGHRAGLVDGDLNAPDVPHMLGVHPGDDPEGSRANWNLWTARVTPPSRRMRPHLAYGLEVVSTGFVIPERRPPAPRSGAEVAALLRVLTFEVNWSADLVLIDCPPGTGDELWAMIRELPLSGALFVTTPQDLAQMDAQRTLTLLREHGVPVIGVVENMTYLICPHCGETIDLFPRSTRLIEAGLDVLGRLPFDVGLTAAADHGRPLVLGGSPGPVAREFVLVAKRVRRWLAEREASDADSSR